jgi:hypothetical protein
MSRPNACISIDVDTLSSIYKGQGCTRPAGYTYIEFRTGIENLARFFEQFNIKSTLFMVGNDFKYKDNLGHIRDIHQVGHEIANHSMTHPQGFRWLSAEQKEAEIRSMGEICRQTVGSNPIGFRSPGWNVDDATIPVLKKLDYRYESSVFPTFLMPAMKFTHWRSMSKQPKPDRTTMGMSRYMFAPIRPYHTSAKSLARRGHGGLAEFPISVTPILRIPFFATTLLLAGIDFYRILYKRIRSRQLPVHFQMHLSDFVDYSLPEFASQMPAHGSGTYVPQSLSTPLAEKLDLFARMIEIIQTDYDFITLAEWTERMEAAR